MSPAEIAQRLPPPWRKRLLWVGAIFVAYVLIGFFVLPPIIKWQLLKQLPDITKRQVAVRQVKVNPLALSLSIKGLALTEPSGERFASWEEFYVNFQSSSLFRWAWTFKEIRLVQPFGDIVLLKNGSLNFANMFPPSTNPPPAQPQAPSAIPRVRIFHLQVTNGIVQFEDRTRRSTFRTEYRPINLDLRDFTTAPNSDTPYSFRAESDAGRSIAWAGDVTVEPLRSSGKLELTGIILPRYQPYFEDFTTARVTNGIADIHVNYRFSATTNGTDLAINDGAVGVNNFRVLDPAGAEQVVGFTNFSMTGLALDLRQQTITVGSAVLDRASLQARMNPEGRLNLLDMIATPEPDAATNTSASTQASPAPTKPWVFTLKQFSLTNATVGFEDLSRPTPFKTVLFPIHLGLAEISNQEGKEGSYTFELTTESAEKVDATGKVAVIPVRSSGEVNVAAVSLPKYGPFVAAAFRGKLASGKLDVRVPYEVALLSNTLSASVANMRMQVSGLDLKAPEGDESVLTIDKVVVDKIEANLQERKGRVGLVSTEGGVLVARRGKEGSINLLTLVPPSPSTNAPVPTEKPAETASAEKAWAAQIDEVDLRSYTVKFEDLQPATPAQFLIDQIAANAKGVSTDPTAEITPTLSLRINETGTFQAAGKARLEPLSSEMDLLLTNLNLRCLQPYLSEFASLELTGGDLSTGGHVTFDGRKEPAQMATFAGGFQLNGFRTVASGETNGLVEWESLALTGIEAKVKPDAYRIGEVRWVGPAANLVISKEGKPNVTRVLKAEPAAGEQPGGAKTETVAAPSPTNNAASLPIRVDSVVLEKAAVSFTDESIQPAAQLGISGIEGSIKGLSSEPNTTADVDIKGTIGEKSPFAVVGRLNPLAPDKYMDLAISNANTQLSPLTPYMEKYAGHPLLRGRLSTDLHYKLQGQALKAENKVRVEQLTLGPKNNSPDATAAPVKLGVALLKDASGVISLDVPVSGRLDDPSFKVGPIVMQVIVNLIVKAAASPFKLLGGLVGAGEELSYVEFAPGSEALSEAEIQKLAKLTTALSERPALNLEIEGAVDPGTDRVALARQKVKSESGGSDEASAEAAIAGTESGSKQTYEQTLREAFIEKFGTNIAAVLQTNMTDVAAKPAASAARKVSFSQRVMGVFGGGPKKSPAEKRLSKADRQALDKASPEILEQLLADTMPVSEEDYDNLMKQRAQRVHDWLVKEGKVDPERLLILPSRKVDPSYKGQSRVTLAIN